MLDGIPRLSSPTVTASQEAAEGLLEWVSIDSNRDYCESFTFNVVESLDKAFPEER